MNLKSTAQSVFIFLSERETCGSSAVLLGLAWGVSWEPFQ